MNRGRPACEVHPVYASVLDRPVFSLVWAHPAFLSQWTGSMAVCVYGMEFVEMYLVNVVVVNCLYIWHE